MTKMLDRLDALEKGPERKSTRKADHAALATLAQRGITSDERARLRGLIETASHVMDPPDDGEESAANAARNEALRKLRAWYDEWSETARAVIKRRDQLIRLGLAKRIKRKAPAEESGGGAASSGGAGAG
jgi:hypothetical protein